jgi:S-formylglutathione hydrolase FrmB
MQRPIFAAAISMALLLAPEVLAQTSRPASRPPRRERPAYTGEGLAGSVQSGDVESKLLGKGVRYFAYLPPGYKDPANAEKRYPIVFFLHGLFENPNRWMDRGGGVLFDEAIKAGKIPPVIVIVPDGTGSFYSDTLDGKRPYAKFFTQELLPWADKTYRTTGKRDERIMAGSSMGGFGALRFAFTHPELFSAVFVHQPAVLPESPAQVSGRTQRVMSYLDQDGTLDNLFGDPIDIDVWKASNPLTLGATFKLEPKLAIYFDCGESDSYGFDETCRALDEVLTKRGVAHEFAIRPGGHGWEFMRSAFPHSLAFLDKHLKAPKKAEDKTDSRSAAK